MFKIEKKNISIHIFSIFKAYIYISIFIIDSLSLYIYISIGDYGYIWLHRFHGQFSGFDGSSLAFNMAPSSTEVNGLDRYSRVMAHVRTNRTNPSGSRGNRGALKFWIDVFFAVELYGNYMEIIWSMTWTVNFSEEFHGNKKWKSSVSWGFLTALGVKTLGFILLHKDVQPWKSHDWRQGSTFMVDLPHRINGFFNRLSHHCRFLSCQSKPWFIVVSNGFCNGYLMVFYND